ncbi:YSIRK-type signal peptide-containing protein [Ulvibacterium marinum]|uniref:YSIRK-type signal peptide-containing protein n=1 Tax=Ulvibacterium marinum TaxID=2419782 RepID=A0A3B0CDA7_9FLAO|nr:YSIRK-type signal peptide-containing protein [Ulvibacterium marinum]
MGKACIYSIRKLSVGYCG